MMRITHYVAIAVAISVACISTIGSARADETVLWNFSGPDGAVPYAALIADNTGALYGTTASGGPNQYGTVFKLTPPARGQTAWTETVLYSFEQDGSDGYSPFSGLIADRAGALYGTTVAGGPSDFGTVFKLTPPARGETAWAETVIYSFAGGDSDGATPYAGLVADSAGALYGTTIAGGTSGTGVVYKLTPPARGQTDWTETVLHSFGNGSDGDGTFPYGGLVSDRTGALYGTTAGGGTHYYGTAFKLTPPARGETNWTETVLHNFGDTGDGATPFAVLLIDAKGALYGTTLGGGTYGHGTAFELMPPARGQNDWTEDILWSGFGYGADGADPQAGLVADKTGALYGTTYSGGAEDGGTLGAVFKLTPPARGETAWTENVIYSFMGPPSDGKNPLAGLLIDNRSGTLYGTTALGGSSDDGHYGVVFQLTP